VNGSLTRLQAAILGIIVLASLSVGAAGLFAVGDGQGYWRQAFDLWGCFPQVNGIEVGTRVRVQGMNAGQVAAIEQPLERGGAVMVRFRLDSRFRSLIAADAHAEIRNEGLIGGKVIEIHPGSPSAATVEPGATIPGKPDAIMEELRKLADRGEDLVNRMQALTQQTGAAMEAGRDLMSDVRQGQGALGKEMVTSLKQFQQTTEAVGRSFDAMKDMPLVGRYVDRATKALIRPNQERYGYVFKADDLFPPERAILTPTGRGHLAAFAQVELPRYKVSGSEIVIAAYHDSAVGGRAAEILTQQQADAVRQFLVDDQKVNKVGFFSRRDVLAFGLGNRPPPGGPVSKVQPPERIEVIVFAPPGSVR
jgi:phospholipid/cholesterol/gamma-HCH transport system substrate-binding protein